MYFGIAVLIIMVIASVGDVRTRQIPLLFIAAGAALSVLKIVYVCYKAEAEPADILLSFFPGVLFLLMAFISREGVGYGDGLMLLSLGPALGGWLSVLGMVAAVFAGGIFSGLLLISGKAGKKTKLPFMPFLTLGMGVLMFAKV